MVKNTLRLEEQRKTQNKSFTFEVSVTCNRTMYLHGMHCPKALKKKKKKKCTLFWNPGPSFILKMCVCVRVRVSTISEPKRFSNKYVYAVHTRYKNVMTPHESPVAVHIYGTILEGNSKFHTVGPIKYGSGVLTR